MGSSISLNPNLTTVAAGSFNTTSEGYIQGTALQDPAVRNELAGGIVAPTETYVMWGGEAISEVTTPVGGSNPPSRSLGGYISRATQIGGSGAAGGITGFSVFDQNHAMISTPQSEVPTSPSGGMMNFYRLGSNARIVVACDPILVDLGGAIINQQVSWDFNLQQLVPYVAAYAGAAATAETYTSSTGIYALTFGAAPGPVAGDVVVITGASVPALNGSWTVASTASGGTILNLQATTGLGALTPTGASLQAGGGAVPCRVLEVVAAGNMTVNFDHTTGFATWNRNGCVAVILI